MQQLSIYKRDANVRGSPNSMGYIHQTITSHDIYFIKGFHSATTKLLPYNSIRSQEIPSSHSIFSKM